MALSAAVGLLILGVVILAAALVYAGRLILKQHSGRPRYAWGALAALLFLFIAGYAVNWIIRSDINIRFSDLEVPLSFFGGCLILAVSALAVTSIQSVRRLAALENENITDPLTGIANYRYFVGRLTQEVARSNRYQPPLSLMIIDVDHFKTINDTYGVRVGDLVLSALVQLVLSIARDTDIAARYGREEIAVIAVNTTAADAARLAERIRHGVETASLLPADVSALGDGAGVTVSIGVSSLGPHVRSERGLVAAAYAALLNAKDGGRNRVVAR